MCARSLLALSAIAALLTGCHQPAGKAPETAVLRQAELGVPEDGYPNYHERLMLVAINRGRAEPNSVELGTAGSCGGSGSTPFAVSDPLVLNLAGSKAARFHCANCLLNDGIPVRTLHVLEESSFYTLDRPSFLDLCQRYEAFS